MDNRTILSFLENIIGHQHEVSEVAGRWNWGSKDAPDREDYASATSSENRQLNRQYLVARAHSVMLSSQGATSGRCRLVISSRGTFWLGYRRLWAPVRSVFLVDAVLRPEPRDSAMGRITIDNMHSGPLSKLWERKFSIRKRLAPTDAADAFKYLVNGGDRPELIEQPLATTKVL